MADLKRVLSIGYEFRDARVQNTKFHEPDSSLGHDLIYWDPTGLPNGYGAAGGNGEFVIKGSVARRFERDLERRSAEFREHLSAGKPIVVAVPSPWRAAIVRDKSDTSYVVDVSAILPTEVKLRSARGDAFERIASGPFEDFWKWVEEVSIYESYFVDPPGVPLVRIAQTNRVVASATQAGSGVVLFLPRLIPGVSYQGDSDPYVEERKAYKDYLDLLWKTCQSFGGSAVLPSWTDSYLLQGEGEGEAVRSLARAESRLITAQTSIQKREQELQSLRERKTLITGTGAALERAVDRALIDIGFEVEPGAPGRTDRIIRRKRRVAVVEIKGKSKSASEKDAAQLEKWKSEYHAEHGRLPKGLLIVNAWRGKPLSERDAPAFPNQMLDFAVNQRKQCLLTTTQLLGLWNVAEKSKARADKLAKMLLDCEGVFPGFGDWQEFLEFDGGQAAG
jgi:hypothetical protein